MSTTPEPVEPTIAADGPAISPDAAADEGKPAEAQDPAPAAAPSEEPAAAQPRPSEDAGDAPADAAPAEDAPAEDAPAEDAPAGDAPAPAASDEDAPAEAASDEDAPAEAASDEDAPAEAEAAEDADEDHEDHDDDEDDAHDDGVIEANPEAIDPEGAGDGTGTAPAEGGKKRRKKKGRGAGEGAAQEQPPKRKGPLPAEVMARIGTTNDAALAYLAAPDPALSRLSRKVTEALLPDIHPVTAGALLGPAGFTRHLVASAAAGRYRDLFVLWEVFRRFPAEAKPELAERGAALARAQEKLKTAVRIGLTGRSPRLAEDIALAEGLIWQWLREALVAHLPAVGARPAVASALLRREPALDVPLPANPDDRWLTEAAAARHDGPLADRVEAVLGEHVHRLPATVETLRLATVHYPERVAALVDRVDLDAPDIGAFLAWARDHGAADRLHGRIRERVAGAAARDRAEGLSRWYAWRQRGVQLELPQQLQTDSLEGFDLAKPETAELAARLVAQGVALDLQGQLDGLAAQNRQLAEKAYEAMVCADLDVTLPAALEDNPVVNPGTRCPNCRAWTWVRPGHEQRCPRPPAPTAEPESDPFSLAAAEAGGGSATDAGPQA
jgi:hypothetical protein